MGDGFTAVASGHAKQRCQQRGISFQAVDFVLSNFDTVLHAGEGCQSVRLSRRAMNELRDFCYNRQILERAGKLIVVMREDNWKVVTVMHDDRNDRRYRRQGHTKKGSVQ